MTVSPDAQPQPSWFDAIAVYLKPRVLIVLFLGFASGLPLALSGSTLSVWLTERGIDLGTIGLFSLVGLPYTFKFLWAPLTDALDVPFLSRALGRRRGWLVFTQIWLVVAIVLLGLCDPTQSLPLVVFGGTLRKFFDQFLLEQAGERAIEGARVQLHRAGGPRVDLLHDAIAVLFAVGQRQQDLERHRRQGQEG